MTMKSVFKTIGAIFRVCLPPSIPFILVLLGCWWGMADLHKSPPPLFADGRPYNAPYYALGFILVFSPIVLVLGIAVNLLDIKLESMLGSRSWLSTPLMVIGFPLLLLMLSVFSPASLSLSNLAYPLAASAFMVVPTSVSRKLLNRKKRNPIGSPGLTAEG